MTWPSKMSPTRTMPSARLRAASVMPRGTAASSEWPAGVVGVLAEDLDPARREAPPLRRAVEDRRRAASRARRTAPRAKRRPPASCPAIRSARRSSSRTRLQAGEPRADQGHVGCGATDRARRPRRGNVRKTTPLATARPTASGNSYSPRADTRHVAAGVEDALVESPHVHADERARSGCVVILAAGLFDDARQAAAIIDFDRGKPRHAIARESRCRARATRARYAGSPGRRDRRARAAPAQDRGCRN